MKAKIILGLFLFFDLTLAGYLYAYEEKADKIPTFNPLIMGGSTKSICEAAATTTKNNISNSDIFAGMSEKIKTHLNDGTEYSVYIAYPQKSATPYIYNSKPLRSASMIKIFILAATMEADKTGQLSIDEVMTLKSSDKVGGAGILAGYATGSRLSMKEVLRLMITESDNTATNMIIDRVGMSTINAYIKKHGYKDTELKRKMMDTEAVRAGRENMSSVVDLGEIFRKIYYSTCVSPTHDKIMLEFLKGQTDMDCFPSALPDAVIAHKTGALIGLYDDGGIIYRNGYDTILVIMTENYTGERNAINHMKAFAKTVAL